VGNLNYQVTSEDLRTKFAEFGEVVDCIVLTDKFSGRSKGFGFVTFASDEQASAALEALNGQPLMERAMAVSIARPPQPRENRGSGGGFRSGGGSDRRGGFSRGIQVAIVAAVAIDVLLDQTKTPKWGVFVSFVI
jgi:RNA recognition motif-containing protein